MTMSASRAILIWAVVLAMASSWAWWRDSSSAHEAQAAQQRSTAIGQQVAHLAELRAQTQIAHGPRADTDLVSHAQRALEQAGVPVGVFNSVQPQGDQQQVEGVHLQEVQLRLQGITPRELGAWLKAWRTPDQPWSIRSLQATHGAQAGAGEDPDGNRFDVSINLTTPYVDTAP